MAPSVVALIAARGGSKGLPGKNVRAVAGKPLIVHSIEAAHATQAIDQIYVTTDDAEIAALARSHDATVIDRPRELATDEATSEAALLHALATIEHTQGLPRVVVFLQPTSPLRAADDLAKALTQFDACKLDSLFSATPARGFMWRVTGEVRPLNYDPLRRPRRQDAPRDVIENGSFYIFKPAVLRDGGSRLGGTIGVYLMPAAHSFEIDDQFDLDLIGWLFSREPARSPFQTSARLLADTALAVSTTLDDVVRACGDQIATCLERSGKVLACGNGGSAAAAQHFIAELVGRMTTERRACPGVSLSSDPSVVSALANDYGYDRVFARQVEGLGCAGDVLVAISTSGESNNVIAAAEVARAHGLVVVSLTGESAGRLAGLSDHCIRIPTSDRQCIQELHLAVLHALCAVVDRRLG